MSRHGQSFPGLGRITHLPAGLAVAALALVAAAAGCQTAPEMPPDQVMQHYRLGNYRQALRGAEDLARTETGADRRQARYIAGLSAYRLGKDRQAIRHLRPLAERRDDELAGEAAATVGLIYFGQDEESAARRYLKQAAERLAGPDKGRAYYHLGRLDQRRGQWASARSNFAIALTYANDPSVRKAIRQRMRTRAFALQFGAYSQRQHAARRAEQVRPEIIDARVRPPRVVASTTAEGQRLYLVQAGRFVTLDQARRARGRLDVGEAIIVPALAEE